MMKNKITKALLSSLFLLLCAHVQAQWQNGLWVEKQAYNWCFGYQVGLEFTTGGPQVFPGVQLDIDEGTVTISNENGELLFYSGGEKVWNKNHQMMFNGDSIAYNAYYDYIIGPNNSMFSSTQYGVVVPKPNNPGIYYLFNANEVINTFYGVYYGYPTPSLMYSVIDMSLDNGLGGVVEGKKNIVLNNERGTEKITAVYKNEDEVWVIIHLIENDDGNHGNRFVAYLVTENGIDPNPVISDVGISYPAMDVSNPLTIFINQDSGARRQMKVSPDGSHIATAIGQGFDKWVQVFDFNKETGKISNPVSLDVHASGLEFSPNSRYLYVGTGNFMLIGSTGEAVYQYDLSLDNETAIKNTKVKLFDMVVEQTKITNMQLGPDGKIYVIARGGNNTYVPDYDPTITIAGTGLDVIEFPNNLGMAAGFNDTPNMLPDSLNAQIQSSLPTFNQSYFESGILYESECFEYEVSFETLRIPGITAISWDFGDGQTGSGLTPTHIYTQQGTYTITATITSNGAQQTATTTLTLGWADSTQTQAPDLSLCGDTAGKTVFDLSQQDGILLNGEDPAVYKVSYHINQNDAQNNLSPIAGITSYSSSGGTIYARVTNTVTGCYVVASFNLIVEETPEIPAGLELIGCSPFDLTPIGTEFPEDFPVSYYKTKTDAQNEQDAITNIENYIFGGEETRVFIRVENTTGLCSDIGELLLRQGDCVIPQGISPNSDGKNDSFDLTFLTASYKGGHISFFNRYGRVVYEEDDYTDQWHGQDMNGNELPTGTYFYVLELGEAHPEYGKVVKSWVYVQR